MVCFTSLRRDAQRGSCHGLVMSIMCRGRTLWLIGDSHTYDLFHSVACLMLDFWDYAFQGSFPTDGEGQAFEAMAQHVVHSKPPECLPLLEGTMVCHFRVNHGQVAPIQGFVHDRTRVYCGSVYNACMLRCSQVCQWNGTDTAGSCLLYAAFPVFMRHAVWVYQVDSFCSQGSKNPVCQIWL